jgi:hypothetical protein
VRARTGTTCSTSDRSHHTRSHRESAAHLVALRLDGHLKGLRQIAVDHPQVRHRIVVSPDRKWRRTEDGIEILPAPVFTERLWQDALIV